MRIRVPLVTSSLLFYLVCTAALAAPPITDAVIPVNPSVTVRLVREALSNVVCNVPTGSVRPLECNGPEADEGGLWFGHDALGFFYEVARGMSEMPNHDLVLTLRRIAPDGTEEVLAHLLRSRCDTYPCTGFSNTFRYPFGGAARFDLTNGSLFLPVLSQRMTPQGGDDPKIGLVEISGFPKLFDTLLTFVPSGQSLTALIPFRPDGFRSSDSFQIWAGDVRTLPNWSRAQPLTCNAASAPAPGQLVNIADTLPDPAVGSGRYYVVASQTGPDRRLGRQYVNGAFSARDPSTLPVCQ